MSPQEESHGDYYYYGPPDLAHLPRPAQFREIRRIRAKDTAAELELARIKQEADQCRACPLYRERRQSVAGSGPADARIMFIGESPGRDEDQLGVPFTGQAGRLLEGLLARAGTNRSEVFITNVLKCHPPNNRDPEPQEANACRSFLERQTEAVNPQIIVPLGRFSTEAYLPGAKAKDVRKQLLLGESGRAVLPIMHPAAALRRNEWRRELNESFGILAQALDGLITPQERAPDPASGKKRGAGTGQEQTSLLL